MGNEPYAIARSVQVCYLGGPDDGLKLFVPRADLAGGQRVVLIEESPKHGSLVKHSYRSPRNWTGQARIAVEYQGAYRERRPERC